MSYPSHRLTLEELRRLLEASRHEAPPPLTSEQFRRLLEEGREARRRLVEHAAPMRDLTAEDLLRRSR